MFDGTCIARNAFDFDIILINYIRYNYLEYDSIEYLYNNDKWDITMLVYTLVNGWKMELKHQKESMKKIKGNLFIWNTKIVIL